MTTGPEPTAPTIGGYHAAGYLGQGGFGAVFLYRDDATGAPVAIKVLHDGIGGAEGRRQLEREALALGRLAHDGPHPNIVTVHGTGVADGRPYLVMEYCRGGSWAHRIATAGGVDAAEVLDVGIQVAGALYLAHQAGIVHRDIKPANIMLGSQGIPKLGDFGIAALTADEAARGSVWYSVEYFAPDLADADHPTALSDLFSLASTLYFALTGRSWLRMPGGDNSPQALEHRRRAAPIPPLGDRVPEPLEFFIRAAMHRDVDVRRAAAPHAREFAERLRDIQLELRYERTRIPIDDPDNAAHPTPQPPAWAVGRHTPGEPPPGEATTAARDDGSEVTVTRHRPRDSRMAPPAPSKPTAKAAVRVGRPAWRRLPAGWLTAGLAVAAVAGIVVINTVVGAPPVVSASPSPVVPPLGAVPDRKPVPVPTVTGTRTGTGAVTFTWTYDGAEDGDTFRLLRTDSPHASPVPPPTEAKWVLDGADAQVCIEVTVVRADGRTTERGGRACA